jgi:hypothetical protein
MAGPGRPRKYPLQEQEQQEPQPLDQQKPVPKPASGTATVVIGCKIPNGIVFREFTMIEKTIRVHGMVSTEEMSQEVGERFTVRGPAFPFGQIPNIPIVGGYALTAGVPGDLARTWFQQNEKADIVRNQLIFAEETIERATSRAKELAKTRSGLEPLDPANLPSEFSKGKVRVETADLSDVS